jgi:aspartate/methionine/tyrosine aminotransferase
MHPLCQQLNDTITKESAAVFAMLSDLGRQIYFPKEGILSQSAEAAKKATKYNATIGTATEGKGPMYLDVIQSKLAAFAPKDLYPYAPPAGKPELRAAWKKKMEQENPSVQGKTLSSPIVTNALTHGLSVVADLFVGAGDAVIIPDKNWENYELTFGIRRGANLVYYPLYNEQNQFNDEAMYQAIVNQQANGKAIVVLNFPNNPTGYTPTQAEGTRIVEALKRAADQGIKIVAVLDDAYFSLFFEDSLRESLFGQLAQIHENILPVKVDGATKEEYVWGFRVGFVTYAHQSQALLDALEQKTLGIIRATISSAAHPSQTFVLQALQDPAFDSQKQAKFEIMKGRAVKVKQILDSGNFGNVWDYYPFNSGYFMCLKLKTVSAETLRQHLLNQYGVGTIALGEHDLRVAFSCTEESQLDDLFTLIHQGVLDLQGVTTA